MTKPTLLFYCQHSLGLGHLARALELAAGLAERFDVVLLNGGRLPDGTTAPAGVRLVNLPPLGHDASYELVSHDPALNVRQACRERRRRILATYEREAPRAVIVELYPFGRKKFEFELLPLLQATARSSRRPVVLCSLRDILVGQRRDQPRHDERASVRTNAFFDGVLVHADPGFARLEESFRPATPLRVPVHYTGFVAPDRPVRPDTPPLPRMLVSAGGGMVGGPLVRAAVEVHRELARRTGLRTTIVAGPFLPHEDWRWLQREAEASSLLDAVRRVDDLCGEISRSALSLSQCGYNTTMDLLQARTPALVVPYSDGKEDEQDRRATRLAALGALHRLPAADLSPGRLLDELTAALRSRPLPAALDLAGRDTTTRLVADLAGVADRSPIAANGVHP